MEDNLKRKETKKKPKKKEKNGAEPPSSARLPSWAFSTVVGAGIVALGPQPNDGVTPSSQSFQPLLGLSSSSSSVAAFFLAVGLEYLLARFPTPPLVVVVLVLGIILPCGSVVRVSSSRGFQSFRWSASFFPMLGWFDSPRRGVSNPSLGHRHRHRLSFFPTVGRYRCCWRSVLR